MKSNFMMGKMAMKERKIKKVSMKLKSVIKVHYCHIFKVTTKEEKTHFSQKKRFKRRRSDAVKLNCLPVVFVTLAQL